MLRNSASTAERVALLSAGFFVAQGIGTGPKIETTIAFSERESEAKFPATIGDYQKARFADAIEGHRQFSNAP